MKKSRKTSLNALYRRRAVDRELVKRLTPTQREVLEALARCPNQRCRLHVGVAARLGLRRASDRGWSGGDGRVRATLRRVAANLPGLLRISPWNFAQLVTEAWEMAEAERRLYRTIAQDLDREFDDAECTGLGTAVEVTLRPLNFELPHRARAFLRAQRALYRRFPEEACRG